LPRGDYRGIRRGCGPARSRPAPSAQYATYHGPSVSTTAVNSFCMRPQL
jgi:hypothetical protein